MFMSFTKSLLCIVTILLNKTYLVYLLFSLQKVVGINSFFFYIRNIFTSTLLIFNVIDNNRSANCIYYIISRHGFLLPTLKVGKIDSFAILIIIVILFQKYIFNFIHNLIVLYYILSPENNRSFQQLIIFFILSVFFVMI